MSGGRLDNEISLSFVEKFHDRFDHEQTRKKIIAIVQEQMKTRSCILLIKEYAAEEIDRRIFRSMKYWATVIFSSLLTTTIGIVLTIIFANS